MIIRRWTIDRGRASELDKNAPGRATVEMVDTTGELDPTNPAYAFNPMTPAAIALRNPVTATDHTVFRGHVARFNYDLYQSENYAVATLELVDGMDMLAATEMITSEFGDLPVSALQTGNVVFGEDLQVAHRITQVLDQAGHPVGLREVFSGNVKVRLTVYAHRTSALAAIQDAADAEFPGVANFYFQKDGRATFHGRLARFKAEIDANYHISVRRAGDIAAVDVDSTRALIFELQYDEDKDKVINSAIATPQAIADADIAGQNVKDTTSIASYGRRSISFENLLTLEDYFGATTALIATKKFATYYVDNFKDPRTRVNKITFRSVDPTHSNAARIWQTLCNVDISDIIRLKTTHIGGGFDEDFFVEGLHYTAKPLNAQHLDVTLTLDVSPRAYYNSNPLG